VAVAFFMEVTSEKCKKIIFRGMEPVRSKMYINDKMLNQINKLNYLGYDVSYEGEKNLNIKMKILSKCWGL
jgi:hypothetical protein